MVPPAPRGPIMLTGQNYNTCTDCLLLDLDCDMNGANCAHSLLGQTGSFSVTSQNIVLSGGSMAGTATNVHFDEWAFPTAGNDQKVPGGVCVEVGSITWNGTWQ